MKRITLGPILHVEKGKKPLVQSNTKLDGYLPYVDIKAFEKGIIDNYALPEKSLLCNDGDLLIVCDGSRSGLTGIAIKGIVGSTLAKISADGMTTEYLRYFIESQYTLLNTQKKGTGTPHLNINILKNSELTVPTLEEQRRIVARIEDLFSQLDNGIETLQKTKQQLEVYRQAVLKEIFQRIEYKVPLGSISDSRLGKMLDKQKNIGIPHEYLRNINVRWFSFDLSDLLEMKFEERETDKYTVCKNDLVICEGGEPGRCAVWDCENTIYFQKALHRVRFEEGFNPRFYMYYMWFVSQTGGLSPYFTGSGIKHLTGQSLAKVPVPVTSRKNQDAMVNEIEAKLSACDNIEKTVNSVLQQSEALRQSILKKVFEG